MRGARAAGGITHLREVCAAGSACALIAGGGAALSLQADLSRHTGALWMSALALAAMMGAPLLMARSAGRHATLASAATLSVTMSAMNALPASLSGLRHGSVVAALMIAAGGALLLYWRHLDSAAAETPHHTYQPIEAPHAASAAALLALLAGLSSGSLARFQLYALCGSSGAQPLWQIVLSLAAVCALACVADRSRGNGMLMSLYIMRAVLIGGLASADDPALAPLAAKIFLLLACLTIPALANLRANPKRVLNASCPGIAHHAGMVTGAALSTAPYFFGDGFVVLFALGAMANLLCAASLASRRHGRKTFSPHGNRYRREAHPSG
ncbi:conserved membrane hypothetical protein [Paraburkholderia ribeironis]|uniref:Uncharacterized protein n=1 Tax=Paraburkholderia ribeironis TaxID=1247936 RepID=A0A1N7RW71_9BURK|nr:hypothetical protein [Paraburkholderia ribeironis]SIT39350.1 conserved membrane hypothetical protein [Paraburkholderia ribeironis]